MHIADKNLHQERMMPMVVYVPLVIQKVAKYWAWWLCGSTRSSLRSVRSPKKCVHYENCAQVSDAADEA
jgi:hypothetical protein